MKRTQISSSSESSEEVVECIHIMIMDSRIRRPHDITHYFIPTTNVSFTELETVKDNTDRSYWSGGPESPDNARDGLLTRLAILRALGYDYDKDDISDYVDLRYFDDGEYETWFNELLEEAAGKIKPGSWSGFNSNPHPSNGFRVIPLDHVVLHFTLLEI